MQNAKGKIYSFLLLMTISVGVAWAETHGRQQIDGSAHLSSGVYEALIVNGSLTFENLVVDEDVQVSGAASGNGLKAKKIRVDGAFKGKNLEANEVIVSGSFSGENIQVQKTLEVDGAFNANHVICSGKTTVAGSMSVAKGKFDALDLSSRKSDLTDTTVKTILVRKENTEIQKLELRGETVVSGDVIFESGVGEVYLFDRAEIQGSVQGAKIIKK